MMRIEPHTPEPGATFQARLESQIVSEVRRRNREGHRRWTMWTRPQVAAAACVLAVVSAMLGGAAVATAYQVQQNHVREQIVANIEQRIAVAQQRVDIARKDHEFEQRKFEVGMSHTNAVLEKGLEVTQALAALNRLKVDVDEARATGQEPRMDLSAPRVNGRDFVSERLQVELSIPETQIDVARRLAKNIQQRIEVGTLAQVDADIANNRVIEAESLRQHVLRKQEIRRQFLDGRLDAAETELRVLESEAEHKVRALAPRIAVARSEVTRLTQRAAVGTSTLVEVAEAKLRQGGLETELLKADLDLLLIRQRIKEYRR